MALTCIIIDDDTVVLEQLTECINDIPAIKLVKSFSCATIALKEIMQMKDSIDILFTDIEMPELSGLELARKIRYKTKFLILVTGHPEYALAAFDVITNAILTKPFNLSKLKTTLASVINQTPIEKPYLFIKTKEDKEVIKILVEEIIYIKASGNYILIGTKDKLLTTLQKLSEIEEKLKDYLYFLRIHKSSIISTKHVEKFKDDFIYLSNGTRLSVSAKYKDSVAGIFDSF